MECVSLPFDAVVPAIPAPGGRLGVLIPTLNAKAQLPKQMAAMAKWLDLVDEIVVVDGHSEDGTVDYLKEHLRHSGLRIISHPRGLWQSWNAGLAQLTTKYVLISTAGDVMEREGVVHLLDAMEKTGADMVLSPPQLEAMDGGASLQSKDWPIHQLLARYQPGGPVVLPHGEVMHWTFWYGSLGASLLGSSASNLYRTALLQACPFPTDADATGDVAWGLRHMRQATKVVITPKTCARFVCHPASRRFVDLEIMWNHACHGAQVVVPFAPLFERQRDLLNQEVAYFSAVGKIQQRWGKAWRLHPGAWGSGTKQAWFQKEKWVFKQALSQVPDYFKVYAERLFLERLPSILHMERTGYTDSRVVWDGVSGG